MDWKAATGRIFEVLMYELEPLSLVRYPGTLNQVLKFCD